MHALHPNDREIYEAYQCFSRHLLILNQLHLFLWLLEEVLQMLVRHAEKDFLSSLLCFIIIISIIIITTIVIINLLCTYCSRPWCLGSSPCRTDSGRTPVSSFSLSSSSWARLCLRTHFSARRQKLLMVWSSVCINENCQFLTIIMSGTQLSIFKW